MLRYSQKDPQWANFLVGRIHGFPMKQIGCIVTALAIILQKSPVVVLKSLLVYNCFDDNGIMDEEKVAELLGLKFDRLPAETVVTKPLIAETNFWGGKHFFVVTPTEKIDTLTGEAPLHDYPIVQYLDFS